MKNYILSLVALMCLGTTVSVAQSTSPVAVNTDAVELAEKAALADENIEKKVCATSGKVSYYQKSTCPASGNITRQPVQFDQAKGQFVSMNVKKECSATKKACSKADKKKCDAKASATGVSNKKSCSKSCKKKCSAKSASAMKAEAKSDVQTLGAGS